MLVPVFEVVKPQTPGDSSIDGHIPLLETLRWMPISDLNVRNFVESNLVRASRIQSVCFLRIQL